jgi:hypothetical protein
MDYAKLASDLLGIVKAAAPLVGLGEEVEAAERVIASATSAYETIKDAISSDDRAALESGLEELAARVNAHADRTAQSLG